MPENRYPKQLFNQRWNIKPRRGRQRKMWGRIIEDIFESLGIDKEEWSESIKNETSSKKSFLACVQESIQEREHSEFERGLNSKVKLQVYQLFNKHVEFKKYLHGIGDVGTRLMFKFRSGTHGLNEELGRHRGREGKSQCTLCGCECESVTHVLWECFVYSNIRNNFMAKLNEILGDKYSDFVVLSNIEKTAFVLGSELWEEEFQALLQLVKSFIVEVWELRKLKLYGSQSGDFWPRSLAGSQDATLNPKGKLGKLKGKSNYMCMSTDFSVQLCCSAHESGCEVDGLSAVTAC